MGCEAFVFSALPLFNFEKLPVLSRHHHICYQNWRGEDVRTTLIQGDCHSWLPNVNMTHNRGLVSQIRRKTPLIQ